MSVDTNLLVRSIVGDHAKQSASAAALLRDADLIAVPLTCLCETAWVLRSRYGFRAAEIARAIRAVVSAVNVRTNEPAANAGLAMLDAGGDFADGVIAHEGTSMGGETFVSFDKAAVRRLAAQGIAARLVEEM